MTNWPMTSSMSVVARFFRGSRTTVVGKSNRHDILDVIGPVVTRPLMASNVNAVVTLRSINITKPVLLLDEADTVRQRERGNPRHHQCRTPADGAVIRNVGDNFEPRTFDVFSPVVLAAIGDLATTIIDSQHHHKTAPTPPR